MEAQKSQFLKYLSSELTNCKFEYEKKISQILDDKQTLAK